MDSKDLYKYCLTKPGAIEDYPFGPDVIVIKKGEHVKGGKTIIGRIAT